MSRQRYVSRGDVRIAHTGIKVWYVMCGTKCQEVCWTYLTGKQISKTAIETVDPNGCLGYCSLDSIFFTRQCAVDNWRYHSKAENLEHVAVLELTAEDLLKKAEKIKKKLRTTKPWQDL